MLFHAACVTSRAVRRRVTVAGLFTGLVLMHQLRNGELYYTHTEEREGERETERERGERKYRDRCVRRVYRVEQLGSSPAHESTEMCALSGGAPNRRDEIVATTPRHAPALNDTYTRSLSRETRLYLEPVQSINTRCHDALTGPHQVVEPFPQTCG